MTKQEIAELKEFIRENRSDSFLSFYCHSCGRSCKASTREGTTDDELDRLLDDFERRQSCYEKH